LQLNGLFICQQIHLVHPPFIIVLQIFFFHDVGPILVYRLPIFLLNLAAQSLSKKDAEQAWEEAAADSDALIALSLRVT
jgi:hypothetical protein